MVENILKTLIVGPMGVGKSQLCNFFQKDMTNSVNRVSDSLESCTQDPKSNVFERISTYFDFIDTAGNNDSDEIDIINLERLVSYLKRIKKIHYIILVLRFGERFTGDTKQYIEALGKIFTVREFFCHLSIVFTKFPNEPSERDLKTRDKHNSEINKLLRNIFQPNEIDNLQDNETYYIDTSFHEENEGIYQKNQEIADKILRQIISIQGIYGPINTENLDITGKNAKLRRQMEIEELKQKLEDERRMKEIAQQEAREARRRQQEAESFYQREKELLKQIDELNKQKKQNDEKIKIKNEKLDALNKKSNMGSNMAKTGGFEVLGSIGLGIIGAAITPICPLIGPGLISFAVGSGTVGAAGVAVGGKIHLDAEQEKKNLKS